MHALLSTAIGICKCMCVSVSASGCICGFRPAQKVLLGSTSALETDFVDLKHLNIFSRQTVFKKKNPAPLYQIYHLFIIVVAVFPILFSSVSLCRYCFGGGEKVKILFWLTLMEFHYFFLGFFSKITHS